MGRATNRMINGEHIVSHDNLFGHCIAIAVCNRAAHAPWNKETEWILFLGVGFSGRSFFLSFRFFISNVSCASRSSTNPLLMLMCVSEPGRHIQCVTQFRPAHYAFFAYDSLFRLVRAAHRRQLQNSIIILRGDAYSNQLNWFEDHSFFGRCLPRVVSVTRATQSKHPSTKNGLKQYQMNVHVRAYRNAIIKWWCERRRQQRSQQTNGWSVKGKIE